MDADDDDGDDDDAGSSCSHLSLTCKRTTIAKQYNTALLNHMFLTHYSRGAINKHTSRLAARMPGWHILMQCWCKNVAARSCCCTFTTLNLCLSRELQCSTGLTLSDDHDDRDGRDAKQRALYHDVNHFFSWCFYCTACSPTVDWCNRFA